MTQEEIISGSKKIAEYLDWIYIPFEPNLGNKLGWFAPAPKNLIIVSPKQGYPYNINGINYKYVCRKHTDFRFYNSWDSLMLAVNKILNTQFEDGEYYRFRTFGLRCERTNEFLVRFERFQVFQSSSLLEATFKAVIQIIESSYENTTRTK